MIFCNVWLHLNISFLETIPTVKDTGFFYGKTNRYDRKPDYFRAIAKIDKHVVAVKISNEKNLEFMK